MVTITPNTFQRFQPKVLLGVGETSRGLAVQLICLLVGFCLIPLSPCVAQVTDAPASTSKSNSGTSSSFTIGDSIQATGRVGVYEMPVVLKGLSAAERKNAKVDSKGDQVKGRLGKIIGGPRTMAAKGRSTPSQWWDIDWESGVDGWTIQKKLQPVQVDAKHGDIQVAAMLRDRPMMASYTNAGGEVVTVTSEDEIWKWAAQRFGTTVNSQRHFGMERTWRTNLQPMPLSIRSRVQVSEERSDCDQVLSGARASLSYPLVRCGRRHFLN